MLVVHCGEPRKYFFERAHELRTIYTARPEIKTMSDVFDELSKVTKGSSDFLLACIHRRSKGGRQMILAGSNPKMGIIASNIRMGRLNSNA